ncbi:hypothetical protein 80A_00111 [Staphylococcus phage 80A]|uniref:Uncharacterized protein n=3 Tax=unclassified Sepunavirus TaxID=2315193 RepID=A0AAX3Y4C3_9CAUD|nr:hypothetical protein BESEP5_00156 [Staphylococcus phage vB_SepM_BE05]WJJ57890.1 hypothetical protein 80A_00111 [Staphylococcus phage 80A]WJJ58084.1 hypothetical protein 80B_00112 [Staphylococcus phage 80B]WJJ58276.1 hypothetical protein 110_00113 [Staphylococcus phage 110]
MYRFLLFSYSEYYPAGGMGDVVLKFNNLSDLLNKKDDLDSFEFIEIYDVKYDNMLYISNKDTIINEFTDYLK